MLPTLSNLGLSALPHAYEAAKQDEVFYRSSKSSVEGIRTVFANSVGAFHVDRMHDILRPETSQSAFERMQAGRSWCRELLSSALSGLTPNLGSRPASREQSAVR